jgi:hypothetical protein
MILVFSRGGFQDHFDKQAEKQEFHWSDVTDEWMLPQAHLQTFEHSINLKPLRGF